MQVEQISKLQYRVVGKPHLGPREIIEQSPWKIRQRFMIGAINVQCEQDGSAIITLDFLPLNDADEPIFVSK